MRRVELLLEKLVNKEATHESQFNFRGSADAIESGTHDLRPYSLDGAKAYDNALVLSLFDNTVVSHSLSQPSV